MEPSTYHLHDSLLGQKDKSVRAIVEMCKNLNSSSDFEIYLPESQECGNDTKLYIHDTTIPNSIYPVQTGLNHTLYLRLTDFSNTRDM